MNNVRLSKGSEESEPKELKSGDIVQFGVDVVENSKKGLYNWLYSKTVKLMVRLYSGILSLGYLHLGDTKLCPRETFM